MPAEGGALDPGAVEIVQVSDAAGRNSFIRVPYAVYRPGDNWVPPLSVERREHLDPARNPYFRHAEAAMWVARRGGRAVGRISAQCCTLHRERHGDDRGQFGFIEAIDDAAVFAALFATAERWLGQRGVRRVSGPFNFSINDEMGLLVDGFDTPPSMMMGHAMPYYAGRIEQLGYAKAKDVIAYDYLTATPLPRSAAAMVERAKNAGDLTTRPLRKKRLADDLSVILDIFNDAWQDNWGFVPMTAAEINALGSALRLLVREEFVAIAYWRGEPAATAVSLPNLNDCIADLGGRLLPLGWAKLAWRLKMRPPRSVRMPLMGVRRKYQGTATGAALSIAAVDAVRAYHKARGTVRAELSWILEDNEPMKRMIEAVGGRPYKTYRIYEKALPDAG